MAAPSRLVLFGPPGAGKGTQAQFLKETLGLRHISSGDLFRRNVEQGTPLGQRAAGYMNQGLLVPDEVVIGIILDEIQSLPEGTGFILDGFPRTREQAEALARAFGEHPGGIEKVVALNVPEAELVHRLGGRFVCRQCQSPYTIAAPDPPGAPECERCGGELYQREDDRPEAVQQRIEVYQRQTLPVLDFYRGLGLLVEVSGVGGIECVNRRVLQALGREGE